MTDTHVARQQWHLPLEVAPDGMQIYHEIGETCDALAVLKQHLAPDEDADRQLADLERAGTLEKLPDKTTYLVYDEATDQRKAVVRTRKQQAEATANFIDKPPDAPSEGSV